MQTVDTIFGSFDRARYQRLRKAYSEAVKANQETFLLDGGEILTALAKYLLEYLITRLEA